MAEKNPFNIRFLDHVAIKVADMARSQQWYSKVLGLEPYTFEEWGAFPVFMLSGKTGVAIFPAQELESTRKQQIRIDHFAFNVDQEAFEQAQSHFIQIEEPFEFQDHHYFHSVYLTDPDGHRVELTCIQVSERDFYKDTMQ